MPSSCATHRVCFPDRESVKLEKPDRKGKRDDASEAMATSGGYYGAGGAAGGGSAGAAGAAGF